MVTESKDHQAVAREQSFLHFLRVADRGRHRASSGGEKRARALALAVVKNVPGLDGQAVDGLIDFIRLAAAKPHTAAEVLENRRR